MMMILYNMYWLDLVGMHAYVTC